MEKHEILSSTNRDFYVLNSLAYSGCTFRMHTVVTYGIAVYMPDGSYCMTYVLSAHHFYVIMNYLKDNSFLKK